MSEENAIPQANEEPKKVEDTNQKPKTEEEVWDLKYNHETIKKPTSEVLKLAQMGMNYPKILEQLESYKNDETIQFVDRIAKESGVSRSEIIRKWQDDFRQREIEKIATRDGVDTTAAEKIFKAEQVEAREKEAQRQKEIEDETKKQREARLAKEEAEFRALYPEVKGEEIPDEVLREWNEGTPLKTAYKAYESDTLKARLKQLEEQAKINATNEDNAASSMGSAQGTGANTPKTFTREQIAKMSLEEYNANRDEIQKQANAGKIK
jgi:hypothetical protein